MSRTNVDKYEFRNHAVLVRFTKARWGIERKDNEAGEAAAKSHDADPQMVKLVKCLINPKTEELAALKKNQDSAGNAFRAMAGPWDKTKGGFWIISTAGYPGLQTVMEQLEVKHDELVNKFIKVLPQILIQAEAQSGNLWDRSLIPSEDVIRDKFVFSFETKVLEGDARNTVLALDKKRHDAIAKEATKVLDERFKNLTAHTHDRVRTELEHMRLHLQEFGNDIKGTNRKRSFKNSLVERMRALADLLPALNIEGDPKLQKLASEITKHLTLESADTLRGNKLPGDNRTDAVREAEAATKRETAADETQKILDNLNEVFGDVA